MKTKTMEIEMNTDEHKNVKIKELEWSETTAHFYYGGVGSAGVNYVYCYIIDDYVSYVVEIYSSTGIDGVVSTEYTTKLWVCADNDYATILWEVHGLLSMEEAQSTCQNHFNGFIKGFLV